MKRLSPSVVLKAWLIAGSLDLLSAFADVWIRSGGTPGQVLKYIASGLFGDAAFQGDGEAIWLGLGIHYLIALFWTLLFFGVYPWLRVRIPGLAFQAITYGLFIWFIMNVLILPITQAETGSFQWVHALKGAVILILAIGWPLAYFARRANQL